MTTREETCVALCPSEAVAPGCIRQAVLPNGHKLAIYNVDGQWFATDDVCSHGEASLSEDGELIGHQVECTWHNGRFDVRTGEACAMPCVQALRSWPVQVVNGQVCLVDPQAGLANQRDCDD